MLNTLSSRFGILGRVTGRADLENSYVAAAAKKMKRCERRRSVRAIIKSNTLLHQVVAQVALDTTGLATGHIKRLMGFLRSVDVVRCHPRHCQNVDPQPDLGSRRQWRRALGHMFRAIDYELPQDQR